MSELNFLEKKIINAKLKEKPFSMGMYSFVMFIIGYYARVKKQIKIDFDSFIIVQVVTSHALYILKKTSYENKVSYPDIKKLWEKMAAEYDSSPLEMLEKTSKKSAFLKNSKLTISSICLVTELPKETVRRKIELLSKKKILTISKKNGVSIGSDYKKIYSEFVPQTTFEVIQLLKRWETSGLLKSLLNFNK